MKSLNENCWKVIIIIITTLKNFHNKVSRKTIINIRIRYIFENDKLNKILKENERLMKK